jgi:hypothetical protein
MVAPEGDRSIVMTRDCFEPGSGFLPSGSSMVWDVGFVTGARIRAELGDFLVDFAIEILPSVGSGVSPHHRSPTSANGRRGWISGSTPASGIDDSTAPVAAECQSFLDNVVAGFGPTAS